MSEARDQMSAALLCGGESTGLGFPKEMLRVDGRPLAVAMADRLAEVFGSVRIVSNRPDFLRVHTDVPIHRDEFPGAGPLAGLHAGLRNCEMDRCFFLACDMPLVHNDLIRRVTELAACSGALAVVPRLNDRPRPLCAVYHRALLPILKERLEREENLSVTDFLADIDTEYVDVHPGEAGCLRDLDRPEDLALLEEAFDDVEPLPVRTVPVHRSDRNRDVIAEEWPLAVHVNGIRLVTVMCLPSALRELAVGLACYLALVKNRDAVGDLGVDYEHKRVSMKLEVEDERVRKAAQLLITSTCGANVYGSPLTVVEEAGEWTDFRVSGAHLREVARGLRGMSPVFDRTGGTHQAALTDGEKVRFFYEDIGRHNAVDKVIGRALLDGLSLERSAVVTTGRISSEMVVKTVRAKLPVLASRGAVTCHALWLAEKYGVTLVGFARGRRLNAYSMPERLS